MNADEHAGVVVIGAGSGGLTVAVGLSRLGRSVVLVEGHHIGGDCTNVGCIPSKSLLHHSRVHAVARPATRRGTREILASVRARRTALRLHEVDEFGSMDGIDLRFGRARLLGDGEVEIAEASGRTVRVAAKHIVVATGSAPRRIPIDGVPDQMVVTNNELFELDDVPDHLVIVGGGPIGVEMAVAFVRLGCRVTVLEAAPQLLPQMLPEAAAIVHRSLTEMGIDVRVGAVAHRYDQNLGQIAVGPLGGDATGIVEDVDRILMAVGRVPNTDGLGLDVAGVDTDAGGRIVIDPKGRTSADGIWACGDVTDRGGTTHLANAWGRRVIKHILAPVAPAGAEPERPAVAFTEPEAGCIGVQPVDVPDDVMRLRVALADIDRGYTDELGDGVLIVDVRRFSGKVLGATVVGPRAGELIGLFALAMKNDLAFHKWYGTVWPYPTYGEAIGRAVDEYMATTLPKLPAELAGWVRGRLRTIR